MGENENFLTYPEVDTGGVLSATASRVTFTSITRETIAYQYNDKGVDYFSGDFVINLDWQNTSWHATSNEGSYYVAVMSNTLGDVQEIILASGSFLGIYAVAPLGGATAKLELWELDSGSGYQSSQLQGLTLGQTYYFTFIRDESVGTYGTIYLKVYSDAAKTTQVGSTLSIALHTSKKDFRYLYAVSSRDNNDANKAATGFLEHLNYTRTLLPVVRTTTLTSFGTTSLTAGGFIDDVGYASVTQHGHCWATAVNPTTADSKTTNGAGSVGFFTSAVTGLTAGTVYYIRAYATNSYGTSYGSNIRFTAGDPSSQLLKRQIYISGTAMYFVDEDGRLQQVTSAYV